MKRTCKRRKAFLGAIIGAVTSIAGSAISAASQRKAQEKQIKRENYINRNQSANNLSAAYSNEEYVDDFLNKTTFKYGGNKTMACGNRKTAKMGISDRYKKQLEQREKDRNKLTFSRVFANARRAGKQTFNWNGKSYTTQLAGEKKNNTSEKTYNATKLANNILTGVTETTKLPINTKTNTIPSASSVIPKSNTLNIADNNGYYDRIKMMKCGGKRKMKCGGKCKKK